MPCRSLAASPSCALAVVVLVVLAVPAGRLPADDWPQWRGPRRDGVWRETGIVDRVPEELEIVWRTPVGAGYAGPAVAEGRVYVPDRVLEEGESNPDDPFDRSRRIRGFERIHCLDAASGDVLWTHDYPCPYRISYPSGPRATPAVEGERVWHLGAMGDLLCLDTGSGDVLWSRDLLEDFGGELNAWGFAASPLVDDDRLVVLPGGADGAGVVALDKRTGEELWRALEVDDPGYSPPVIIEAGGRRQLVVWTPEHVNGLDPGTGEVLWQVPFQVKSALSVATPVHDAERDLLFVTAFYNGPFMLRLEDEEPAAELLWRGTSESEIQTEGLHSIISTPVLDGGFIYGVCSYGQLRCLNALTGKRVWETLEATGRGRWWNAFIIPQGDRCFIANEQGELISARLRPDGYHETGRAQLIEPTRRVRRRTVVWSHPAFANRRIYARSDEEIVCAELSAAAYAAGDGAGGGGDAETRGGSGGARGGDAGGSGGSGGSGGGAP